MASSPTEIVTRPFKGSDGAELVWHELGEGRPVILLHGYLSDARTNWIRYGHAAKIAAKRRRVIMPDLRAHGQSAAPHDPAAYPPDALVDDAFALIEQLHLTEYDLGGYSLGARTASRMLVRGATPERVVLSGMGLDGLTHTDRRVGYFRRALTGIGTAERGSGEWFVQAFLKTTGGDPAALLLILNTFVDTPQAFLETMDRPTLVLAGDDDRDNGSAAELAGVLPDATLVETPGNHMNAVTRPELGDALADFLAA